MGNRLKASGALAVAILLKLAFPLYILASFLFTVSTTKQPKEITALRNGLQLQSFQLQRNYVTELEDYAVEGNCLYVLFGDMGVMEVYSLDGTYKLSYAYETEGHGHDELQVDKDGLWLFTKEHRIYLFKEGAFNREIHYQGYRTRFLAGELRFLSEEEKRKGSDGTVYERRFSSIYCISSSGTSKAVVKRPVFDLLAEPLLMFSLHATVLLLMIFLIRRSSSPSNASQRSSQCR